MAAVKALILSALVVFAAPLCAEALRLTGDRIFVPIHIEGVATEALLDSGAEMTLVDADFARRLGLDLQGHEMARGTGGEQAVRFAAGVDLVSAGVRLTDRTAAVLDLSDISRRLIGEPLTVVLGRELFDAGRFVIDLTAARIEPLSDGQIPMGVELPLRDHAGIKQMPVVIDGVETWADFDLGNGSEMLLGRAAAERYGWLGADRIAGTKSGGGLGGEVTRELVRVPSVRIAGVELGEVIAGIDATDSAAEANVGVALLRHFVITVDFPANKLWLAPVDARQPNQRPTRL